MPRTGTDGTVSNASPHFDTNCVEWSLYEGGLVVGFGERKILHQALRSLYLSS